MKVAFFEILKAIFMPPTAYVPVDVTAEPVAEIQVIKGDINIRKFGQTSWRALESNEKFLYDGDRIFVDYNSNLTLSYLKDDATLNLANFAFLDLGPKAPNNLNLLRGVQSKDSLKVTAEQNPDERADLNQFAETLGGAPSDEKVSVVDMSQSVMVMRPSKSISAVFPEGKYIVRPQKFPVEVPVIVNASDDSERLHATLWTFDKERFAVWSGVSAPTKSELCRNTFCYLTTVIVTAPGRFVLSARTTSQRVKLRPIYIDVQTKSLANLLPETLKPRDMVMIP